MQDLYAGVSGKYATETSCEQAGGIWRNGIVPEILEDEMPPPFSAIRPLLLDPFPATEPGAMSRIVLSLTGTAPTEPSELSFEGIASEFPRAYWVVGEQVELESIQFFDRSGGEHFASVDAQRDGAYTVIISGAAEQGASATFDLVEQ